MVSTRVTDTGLHTVPGARVLLSSLRRFFVERNVWTTYRLYNGNVPSQQPAQRSIRCRTYKPSGLSPLAY